MIDATKDYSNHPKYCRIKDDTIESLRRYAVERIPTGGFLEHVLGNNLMAACAMADAENAEALHTICTFIYNEMPHESHGNYDQVRLWLERKV